MLNVIATKGITAGLSAIITFGLGICPWKLGKYVDPKKYSHQIATSLLLCFGGGVLLATSLAHMAPEVKIPVQKMSREVTNIHKD